MTARLEVGIRDKLSQWSLEAEINFCRLAKLEGSTFENITYPTELKTVKVYPKIPELEYISKKPFGIEVGLSTAKKLRANNYILNY